VVSQSTNLGPFQLLPGCAGTRPSRFLGTWQSFQCPHGHLSLFFQVFSQLFCPNCYPCCRQPRCWANGADCFWQMSGKWLFPPS
jgi:hypothetical protein